MTRRSREPCENLKPEFYSDSSQFSVILKNLNYGKSLENLVINPKNQAIKAENPAIAPKTEYDDA